MVVAPVDGASHMVGGESAARHVGGQIMMRTLVSTTSALALLVFGGGRATAAPMAAVSDTLLFGTADRTDVVRQSLSLGAAVAPLIGGVAVAKSAVLDRPTIADPSASTPSATYTYRPAVSVRGDAGLVGTIAANSRRNPGNVSNLKGTIGAGDAGIYAVPTTEISVDETPGQTYNYIYRPRPVLGSAMPPSDPAEAIPKEPFGDSPSHSVFIGVRTPVADAENERAKREASIIGATGSATPTVVISALPGRVPAAPGTAGAGTGLAYQVDAGPATTIGFSTAWVRPTPLRPGAAASSTLGYTYVPFGAQGAVPAAVPPHGETVSATITAPDGGPARRDWRDRGQTDYQNAADDIDAPLAAASTASGSIAPARDALSGFAADTFASGAGGERVAIPILVKATLAEPRSGARSLYNDESIEMEEDTGYARYGLVTAVLFVPLTLAFFGFRIIRRAALRRLA
jgi:hypothetical protein